MSIAKLPGSRPDKGAGEPPVAGGIRLRRPPSAGGIARRRVVVRLTKFLLPVAALALLAMAPALVRAWRRPRPSEFLDSAAYACLCSFVFGYHVHEKAILMVRRSVMPSDWRADQAIGIIDRGADQAIGIIDRGADQKYR